MKKFAKLTVLLLGGGLLIASSAVPAHALVITDATLSGGNVSVSGNKAQKSADIYWLDDLNNPVATSNSGGAFHFSTAIVPADCIARVSDGGTTPDATTAISGCGTSSLPATGQTMCWDPTDTTLPIDTIPCTGTGQDGGIQAGATLSYTDNGDGTITDNNTRLVWEKKTNCTVSDPTNDPHCYRNLYTWAEAFAYVAALNTANFASHNDWRLPNVKELHSIVNHQYTNPSVSPEFNDCTNGSCTCSPCNVGLDGFYWSSTSLAASPDNAWKVIFNVGSVITDFKTFTFQVRAVRSGL